MLGADSRAGGACLAGGALELGVGTLADAALAGSPSVTDLLVGCQAGGGVQGAVAGAARVVGVADAHPALTAAVPWEETVEGYVSETGRTPWKVTSQRLDALWLLLWAFYD